MSSIIKKLVEEIFENNVDGITFFPKDLENIDLRGFCFEKKSRYKKTELGNIYHIMIYKIDESGFVLHKDNFEAVLTDPAVYTSNIINCGFHGIVVKKTHFSKKLIRELYSKFENNIFLSTYPLN